MDNIAQIFTQSVSNQISIWVFLLAFLGGLISSFSPCSLGFLPVIVGYVSGTSEKKDKRTIIQILFFILGLSLVLTGVGVTCALTGQVFGAQSSPVWALVMASLILVMGLTLLNIIELPMPMIVKQMPTNKNNTLILYPMLIGAAFAFASSPCSTPILAGIMAYSSMKANISSGAIMLFLFSLGQGTVLLIAGVFTSLFKKLFKFRKYSEYFMKFSGIVLILAAMLIYAKVFMV
ncbi:MAG: cytochrome c biogenesis protein CcdA [Candidatus Gastranaerophilales bacterium]|nr:cytochrome c biogenesis protein CcdA [Candidatus Gastranaerophilales bacterium]